ncbi:ABC transporter permease [Idiomarina ramblicola]|uniref:Transport permease protein n=1 Tax=Idiomarina ramblicola TaxID=263724 RepID=A0A432Z1M4_9GAMM|nr:ABC transporter permease [Idiomarina ramblicola]RUO71798.1 ABC transporter permease [Idiomarina ramblicola]
MSIKPIKSRSPYLVTWHVYAALFMREFTARLTQDRFAPVWLFIEPILHVSVMVAVRNLIGRTRLVPGADFIPWLVVGVTTFILFRTLWNKGMTAITRNRTLFSYRQVHPADTVVVSSAMESKLQSIVLLMMIGIFTALGFDLIPHNPLGVMEVWIAVGLLGLGFALCFSVLVTFFPESAKIVSLISLPLYMLSGVIIPIQMLPHSIQQYLLYNPMLHAIELIRGDFFATYHMVRGVELSYVYEWAICTILLGLALQVRYKVRMISR